ncbi:MAG: GspH/FimT family pseudopilin [Gammaproteobacteria bacterium]|nr:GspH/FimT family pseudopilin [Gammaproteobacteria bacterium]
MVELMVTLVVAAILLSIAIPSFRALIQNNKSVAQTNQLVAALNHARSEALKRHARVVVCAMNSGQTDCDGASTNWGQNGWMAFADTNGNGSYDSATETLLRQWRDTAGKSDFTISASAASLVYLQTGAITGGAFIGILLNLDGASDYDRCVLVFTTGRVKSKKMASGETCP